MAVGLQTIPLKVSVIHVVVWTDAGARSGCRIATAGFTPSAKRARMRTAPFGAIACSIPLWRMRSCRGDRVDHVAPAVQFRRYVGNVVVGSEIKRWFCLGRLP